MEMQPLRDEVMHLLIASEMTSLIVFSTYSQTLLSMSSSGFETDSVWRHDSLHSHSSPSKLSALLPEMGLHSQDPISLDMSWFMKSLEPSPSTSKSSVSVKQDCWASYLYLVNVPVALKSWVLWTVLLLMLDWLEELVSSHSHSVM